MNKQTHRQTYRQTDGRINCLIADADALKTKNLFVLGCFLSAFSIIEGKLWIPQRAFAHVFSPSYGPKYEKIVFFCNLWCFLFLNVCSTIMGNCSIVDLISWEESISPSARFFCCPREQTGDLYST